MFTGTGTHQFSKAFGSAAADSVSRVAFDSQGNLVLAGFTAGSVDLGGGALVSTEENDPFLGKLLPTGEHIWSGIFGTVSEMETQAVAVGAGDIVLLGGEYDGTLSFGPEDPPLAGLNDAFLAAFGP